MGLGEIPARTSMRGYWHLEDVSDASGNGNTLTNVNSVSFSAGKFNNCAAFSVAQNSKALVRTSNILSALNVANFTVSFWFKLNSTANNNGHINQIVSAFTGPGSAFIINYNIADGAFSLGAMNTLTTTNARAEYNPVSIPLTTEWLYVCITKVSTITVNMYINGSLVSTDTGVGTEIPLTGTYNFTIGNHRASIGGFQMFASMDEYILEERIWSLSEIRKYYSQGRGFLAAA